MKSTSETTTTMTTTTVAIIVAVMTTSPHPPSSFQRMDTLLKTQCEFNKPICIQSVNVAYSR